jgi:MFS family permease
LNVPDLPSRNFPKMKFFYGWYIVIVGMVANGLGYGSRYSFSVIFPSLLEEFKWPRDITAAVLSVHILIYGIAAPVTGFLVDRTGPRKTMGLGAFLLSLGLILSCWGTQPWHFWVTFGVLAGMGLCFMGSVPFTTVVRNWFDQRRGLAFSLVFSGFGWAFACYPVIAWLIEKFGWRATFLILGIFLASVLIPLFVWVLRYHPRELGLLPDGFALPPNHLSHSPSSQMQVVDRSWAAVDWTFPKAVKTRRFWLLGLTTFSLWGIMQQLLLAHHVAFAIDVGFPKIYASAVLSLFGFTFALGALAGLVSDRIGREVTLTIATIIGISGILVLSLIQVASRPWMLYYYAMSVGVANGLSAPTIAASVTDIFQGAKVGFIIGAIWFGFALGGTIGPWLGGWLFEVTGNYVVAFAVAMALFAVACVAIWFAAPRKVRRGQRRASGERWQEGVTR